jgi:hypothetical protein
MIQVTAPFNFTNKNNINIKKIKKKKIIINRKDE